MRRIVTLLTIFIALSFTASAQGGDLLTSFSVEPVRPRMVSYGRVADAVQGDASLSRYAISLAEWSEVKGEGATTYTAHFPMSVGWLNRQVLLRIGYAERALRVLVNGQEVGISACGVYGAEFNITKRVQQGRNEVKILIEDSAQANTLYAPRARKGEKSNTSFRDVEILSPPTIRIRDIICQTRLNEVGDGVVEVAIPVKCDALNRKVAVMNYALRLNDTTVIVQGTRDISLAMRAEDTLRFATIVPKAMLWSAQSPTLLRLDIESRIENRIAECVSREVALCAIDIRGYKLYMNGSAVTLRLAEWGAVENLDEVVKYGYNGIILDCDYGVESLLHECQKRGLYAVVRAPIDTTELGDHIRKGGNPTNNPIWKEAFVERCVGAIHATKGYGAVVGYMLGRGKTTGVNIYEAYLAAKALVPQHIVIYEGAAGEWCSDVVTVK